jgi:23S rRNA G2445 N2-methylase RlmL
MNAPAPLLRWLATCPEETKDVLVRELQTLGVSALRPVFRGVGFEADLETGYRAHLWLRTASRIQRLVAEFPAGDLEALRSGVASIDWPTWLRPDRAFSVAPILTDAAARELGEDPVREVVASAVVSRFSEKAPKHDPEATFVVPLVPHLRGGVCTLGIDTAGKALHKRGWRVQGHPAVLKETLAASILLLADYDGTEPLLDPMCGSGTLVVEAAYIALGKAPLIHRGKDEFALEHLAGFDRATWRRVGDRARAAKRQAPAAPLFARDVRDAFVEVARQASLKARVERYLSFGVGRFQDLPAPECAPGLVVANLPYGERIGRGELQALCKDVGRTLRERHVGWRAALLVSAEAPRDAFGMAPERSHALLNGALEVRLDVFGRR